MDLLEIQNTIKQLEQGETTFVNCEKLASLYIVSERLGNTDEVENELDDILPAYRKFCDVKRQYQSGFIDISVVLHQLELLCTEIQEFISVIYSNTNSPEERYIIVGTLQKLYENYVKNP